MESLPCKPATPPRCPSALRTGRVLPIRRKVADRGPPITVWKFRTQRCIQHPRPSQLPRPNARSSDAARPRYAHVTSRAQLEAFKAVPKDELSRREAIASAQAGSDAAMLEQFREFRAAKRAARAGGPGGTRERAGGSGEEGRTLDGDDG